MCEEVVVIGLTAFILGVIVSIAAYLFLEIAAPFSRFRSRATRGGGGKTPF